MDNLRENIIIILLILLLLVTILGVNLITLFLNIFEFLYYLFVNLFSNVFSTLGFTAGLALNETAEIAKNTSKVGIDIVGDSIEDVGKILINASGNKANSLEAALKPKKTNEGFSGIFDNSDSMIQKR